MSFIMVLILLLGDREKELNSAPIKGDGTRQYRASQQSSCSNTDKKQTDRRVFL